MQLASFGTFHAFLSCVITKSIVPQAMRYICYALTLWMMCFSFLECREEWQEVDIVQHLFPDHLLFVCLHFLNMLDSSGWCHSFAHISTKWVQRGGKGFALEWGWSECCQKGNSWWMDRPDLEICMWGYWKWNAECGNSIGNCRLHCANGPWIRLMRFHPMILHIHEYGIECY